jgi:glycerol-3-phosphate dehydrogenase (NAD(P)+)
MRENSVYLPGVPLPPDVEPTGELGRAIGAADAVVLAVPSQALRGICARLHSEGRLPGLVLCGTKGLEVTTLLRMSEVAAQYSISTVQVGGPSHAEEVGRGAATAVVVGHPDQELRQAAQVLLSGGRLRAYASADRVGVELGGALKNVLGLAAGVIEGLRLGDNLRAALLTRGLAEITRLGVSLGAEPATFSGLAGLGDLFATVTSPHSRNRRAGISLGQGQPLEQVLAASPMVVEGVPATRAALALAERQGVELPIAAALSRLMFLGADPAAELQALMRRALKDEERWPS